MTATTGGHRYARVTRAESERLRAKQLQHAGGVRTYAVALSNLRLT